MKLMNPATTIEKLKVRLSVRLFWWNPEKKARVISRFHATEADSAWQLAHILPRVPGPKERNEVFQHILEEMVHADLFHAQAVKTSRIQVVPPGGERRSLYQKSEPIWKFFAYCIIGEKAALDRFSHVAAALPDSQLRNTFIKILRDEAGHVHNAKDLAGILAPSPAAVNAEVKAVRLRRLREGWMRQGHFITDILANIFLGFLYFIVSPFGWLTARKKMQTQPEKQLKVERQQSRVKKESYS